MNEKKSYITMLNALGCFAVVMLHTNSCFWSFSRDLAWSTANIIESVMYFAVPVFYMLTGATLIDYRERYTTKEFFIRRAKKTLIPFIAWSLIAMLYRTTKLGGQTVTWSDFNPLNIWNDMMGSKSMSVYWFFPALFGIYLAMPLLSAVQKELRVKVFSFMSLLALVLNVAVPFAVKLSGITFNTGLNIPMLNSRIIYPLIGYVLSHREFKPRERAVIFFLAIAGLAAHIIGTQVLSFRANKIIETYKGYTNLPAICYSAGVFIFVRYGLSKLMNIKAVNWTMGVVAAYSFAVYLIHDLLLVMFRAAVSFDTRMLLWRVGGPFAVVPICICIAWLLRRIPVVRAIVPK